MQIILATSNKGKVKEIQSLFKDDHIIPFKDILGPLEIEENGSTFAENALIKAKTIFNKLNSKDVIVISDDSGITVPTLNNEPGIYSARYAGIGANDKQNLNKLVENLKKSGLKETLAYYTAAIAIIAPGAEYVMHGWMYGKVIDEPRGDGGFGYDPMFIPEGFDKTLGELDPEVKKELSHRSKALTLAKPIIEMLKNR
ncbi:RdgB/HAM1 family non-canonical purine NTP pyrophosphatase [Hydrogenimonas thermophila]|uniref:RdgB/HAM1 family non-canonical purine NTP pyrophosphatase n=1 Tax=Hydrogenimonas thermophila TaxID=223786 RepID=UPI002936DCD1|nr:RdgB/HAM1 family non-canonical purine NTP pyrophosphatase [Hydrogenimonas thermophila]WOE70179.1 RdgB/HAM1 family non-canonical purine NTP pyrophosphatase [Hydrogenimonas thermophila]WOE72696.1 RdgB/HAM1 family non-canonical purine NTP pyrophosphatase [Hydrogenimonas thermophila]